MTCERFENHIADYLEGELEPARHEELMAHVETCEACAAELRGYMVQDQELERYFAQGRERLAALPNPVAGMGQARVVPMARPWRKVAWAAAALAMLTVGLATWQTWRVTVPAGSATLATISAATGDVLLMRNNEYVTVKAGDLVRQGERLKVGAAGYAALALEGEGNLLEVKGGTQVALNDFPNRFEIKMNKGQIWAHLATWEKMPEHAGKRFTVQTAQLTATARGTVYGVEEELDRSIVRVAQGIVDIVTGGNASSVGAGASFNSREAGGETSAAEAVAWSQHPQDLATLLAGQPANPGETVLSAADPSPAPTPQPQLAAAQPVGDLAAYLPNNTRFFLNLRDLPMLMNEFHASEYSRLSSEPALRAWWEGVHGKEFMQTMQKELHLLELLDVAALLKGQIALGITQKGDFIMLAECRGGAAEIQSRLSAVITGGEKPLATSAEQATADRMRRDLLTHVAIVSDYFILGSNTAVIAETASSLGSATPSGFEKTDYFQKIRAEENSAPFTVALDLAGMLDLQSEKISADDRATYDFLGLGTLDYAILSPKFKGRGMLQAARLGFKNQRAGVLNWLAAPAPMRGLDFFSNEVRLFSSAMLKNPSVAYYDLMLNYKNAPEYSGPRQMLKFLGEHKALLDALGGEISIGLENPIVPIPNIKVVIELRDPQAFGPLFDGLVDQVVAEGKVNGHVAYVEEADYKGRVIHSLVIEGAPIDLSWAYVDDFLVLGPGPRFVENSIDVHESGHSIADDSKLLDLLPEGRNATFSLLTYQNLAAIVPQFLKSKMLPALDPEHKGLIPDLSFMEHYQVPGIAYAYADSRSIDFYLNAPSGIDLNMGMAVPAFANWLAQRTSIGQTVAGVVKAEEGLDKLAAAAMVFKKEEGRWPASLAELLKDGGVYIKNIPEDPFGVAPGATLNLTAGPGSGQITFYSIGPDGTDDHAKLAYDPSQLEGKGDIMMTLPLPELADQVPAAAQ